MVWFGDNLSLFNVSNVYGKSFDSFIKDRLYMRENNKYLSLPLALAF